MLEKLAAQYYAEEELSPSLQKEIEELHHRAETFLPGEAKDVLDATHSFHDWYLTTCSVECNHAIKSCKLTVSKGRIAYHILFSDVKSLSIAGKLASEGAVYPGSDANSSLAQVLALWIDCQKSLDFCLLLDNERYITIRAKAFSICK